MWGPSGAILGPLIFLLYENDIARVVNCDLLLYADDSCLTFRDKNIKQIESNLNRCFNSLWDWSAENKRRINFEEDKTKLILYGSKYLILFKHKYLQYIFTFNYTYSNCYTTLQVRYHEQRKTMTTPWPIKKARNVKLAYNYTTND